MGYGTDEALPVEFFLPEGRDLDVSFVKLMLFSTQRGPFEMQSLHQTPPVDSDSGCAMRIRGFWDMPTLADVWDTVVIPVIVRPRGGNLE